MRVGASHVIDTSDPAFVTLDDAVRHLFPAGVSVAIDTTGVSAIIEQGIESTCARGRVVFIGMPRPGYKLEVDFLDHMQVGGHDVSAADILLIVSCSGIQKGRSIIGCVEGDCVPQEVSLILHCIDEHS